MDNRLIVLKLFLDRLGIETCNGTREATVHYRIYLAQLAGLVDNEQGANTNLGYRFGWKSDDLFSSDLSRDYKTLCKDLESGDTDFVEEELRDEIRESLDKMFAIMSPPPTLSLSGEAWTKLLAILDYLWRVREIETEEARQRLMEDFGYEWQEIDKARNTLHEADLWTTV